MNRNGLQTKRTPADEADYFGHLAKIALWFYISTGNEAELRAAYYYTRYATRAALVVLGPDVDTLVSMCAAEMDEAIARHKATQQKSWLEGAIAREVSSVEGKVRCQFGECGQKRCNGCGVEVR